MGEPSPREYLLKVENIILTGDNCKIIGGIYTDDAPREPFYAFEGNPPMRWLMFL